MDDTYGDYGVSEQQVKEGLEVRSGKPAGSIPDTGKKGAGND